VAEPTHKLYVDDSGTKEYSPDGAYSITGGGRTPFFVFGGILLTPSEAGTLGQKLRALKRMNFGTEDVEIKANWLRVGRERERRYINKFGISDLQLKSFVDETYGLIVEANCKLLAVLVDKSAVQAAYGLTPWYAPAIAYECLMQRAQLEMMSCDGWVHVTVDDMDGATPRGKQYRDNLERHHKLLKTQGSRLQQGRVLDRLLGISFADSRCDERLQLADLVSYAVYRQWIEYPEAWDAAKSQLPLYDYLGRLSPKFCCGPNGVVAGYGLVKFPTKAHRRWGITADNKAP